uniref:Exonuclease SbcC n=1 Tax=uncultured Thiotrichaceae bacterium TaxID=298394 RepID=A0A6S6U1F3_9GAMM|nr:MAG: Exonuclease SbcC [uncultured Thiotrichaceae bacterium]
MVITELLVVNFRKYENLHLTGLPEKGLIAVNGSNESGKSSLGDAICFALFGRTSQLAGKRISKLVHWGEEEARIILSLQHRGKNYRLTRVANTDGEQTASLWSVEDNETLADTTDDVDEVLKKLLGFGYPAFIKTFYWNQQGNEDSRADTESLQAMAGVKAYIGLEESFKTEQQTFNIELEKIEKDHKASVEVRDATGVDQNWLPELVEVRESLEHREKDRRGVTQSINQVKETYTEKHGDFHQLTRKNDRLGWLSTLGLVLLVVALLAWALLTFAPDLLASVWPEAVKSSDSVGRGLLWFGVAVAIVTSILMFYGWNLERKIRLLYEQAGVMSDDLQQGVDKLNVDMESYLGEKTHGYLSQSGLLYEGADDKKWQSDPVQLGDLSGRIRTYEADPLETIAAADGVSMALDRQNSTLYRCARAVDRDVEIERVRVDEYILLNNEVQRYESMRDERLRGIKVREKGRELINKASLHAIRHFNRIVHGRCQTLLSDFTQSNYTDLEIDNNFTLKVLSEEKGDYLEFEEISAGTQRQIALAMRVSLANTLAESTDAQGQFIFLDEPFAFFDPERTTATINRLYESTAGNLSQIWVTVQGIPEGLDAAFMVDC